MDNSHYNPFDVIPRHASRIAAVLVSEGHASSPRDGNAVLINFRAKRKAGGLVFCTLRLFVRLTSLRNSRSKSKRHIPIRRWDAILPSLSPQHDSIVEQVSHFDISVRRLTENGRPLSGGSSFLFAKEQVPYSGTPLASPKAGTGSKRPTADENGSKGKELNHERNGVCRGLGRPKHLSPRDEVEV